MDSQIRVAVVGVPNLDDKLKKAAERHMPSVVSSGDIEYEVITPHGTAAGVAAELASLVPDIILLGFPQDHVSALDIAGELLHFNLCPIVLVHRNGARGGNGSIPDGYAAVDESEVAHVCAVIQEKVMAARRPEPRRRG